MNNPVRALRVRRTQSPSHPAVLKSVVVTLVILAVPSIFFLANSDLASQQQRKTCGQPKCSDIQSLSKYANSLVQRMLIINQPKSSSSDRVSDANFIVVLTFVLLFPFYKNIVILWNLFNVLVEYTLFSFRLIFQTVVRCKLRLLLFLVVSSLISFLLLFALHGTLVLSYGSFQVGLVTWLEKNVVHLNMGDAGMEVSNSIRKIPPKRKYVVNATSIVLVELFRYPGEDVRLVCEYQALGGKTANIKPGWIWWHKDGQPILDDDSVSIDVSVTPASKDISKGVLEKIGTDPEMEREIERLIHNCSFRNTLTIQLIKESHYGSYTCLYHTIPIFDYRPHEFWEPPGYFPLEFELIRNTPKKSPFYANVTVGGVLSIGYNYLTFAEKSDVEVDFMLPENSTIECCSVFLKLYWIFFKCGGFVDLPGTRVLWHNDYNTRSMSCTKWICICKDTPSHQTIHYFRRVYNSTLKSWDIVQIQHPLSLSIISLEKGAFSFLDNLQFCDKSPPRYSLCWFLDAVLENEYYTIYAYDVGFIFIFVIFVFPVRAVFMWIKRYVLIPARTLCFNLYAEKDLEIEAVHGRKLRLRGEHKPRWSLPCRNRQTYDVYISYCQGNNCDRDIALHFKNILQQQGQSVFDPNEDILPGELTLNKSTVAIHNSTRFVVFTSAAYNDDDTKRMEFDVINDVIKSQATNPKSRLLVIRVGLCDVEGLHRVPCIQLPVTAPALPDTNLDQTCYEEVALDQVHEIRFREWELATRPSGHVKQRGQSVWKELNSFGFNYKSVMVLIGLTLLASHSSWFRWAEDVAEDAFVDTKLEELLYGDS